MLNNICLDCGCRFENPKKHRYTTMVSLEFGGMENIGCIDDVCPNCDSINIELNTTQRYFQCTHCGLIDNYDHLTDDGEHEVECPKCKSGKCLEEL